MANSSFFYGKKRKKSIYKDKKHVEWRAKIIKRDNNKCVICGGNNRLTAHHLISAHIYEHRHDINNGITLCARHHSAFGQCLSPHNEMALAFACWLQVNRPWQWEHAKDSFRRLAEKGIGI